VSTDQAAVDRFEQRANVSASVLNVATNAAPEPTHSQLERYRLGRGYTGMSNEYFGTVQALEEYMQANDYPPPWQQATEYLKRRFAQLARKLTAKGQTVRGADLGSGFNRFMTWAVQEKLVTPENAVGVDLLPQEMMQQLVRRGTLEKGSDTLHVTGRIEEAPQLLAERIQEGGKFNLVTSSFSLMGKDPSVMASYFRAANQILQTGGHFMVLLPLSSFSAAQDATFKEGLAEMGFVVERDEVLKTVGSPIRYLELQRVRDPLPNINVQKFLMK
jgi:SAM-dependent methyltransferase